MEEDDDFLTDRSRQRAVPSGRLSRLGTFGRLAGGVAGNVIGEGARRLAAGERPRVSDLVLTPGNAKRLADRLAHLRGAAMKMGQMISMDAGDLLPPELAEIMARLRDQAQHMPPGQLKTVLAKEWGKDWRRRFKRFGPTPVAAASIGQVHRAQTPDGRDLAIKIQYPGVAKSIDSDVDNVVTLLRISGLVPKELDLAPLLEEAKKQLHEEADYEREGAEMERFAALLEGDDRYVVPRRDDEFTTQNVLAMSFIEGSPIEGIADEPQDVRNEVMTRLIELVLRELFEFGHMQTDPNFANYRYQADGGRLVLLDFGASRAVEPHVSANYRNLLRALFAGDRDAVRQGAIDAGFLGPAAAEKHRALVDRMIDIVLREIGTPERFDFGDRAFVTTLAEMGQEMAEDRETWHVPPADMIFVQRKISGTALLAARLKAVVDIRALCAPYLEDVPQA